MIISHRNLLNKETIGRIITEINAIPFLREDYFVLIDIRKAIIELDSDEIADLSNFVYDQLDHRLQKFAILSPNAHLSKTVQFVRNYKHSSKYQVFTTLEPLLNWLKVPQSRKYQIQIKLDYFNQSS
ncbi:hypothetical protein [Mangrovibacterium lignilyticum]|uniref:hypothetical protein n=1 Tax=Mangrovibacterium lignilyticum TaxID=2668052 RepID=UPI0013D8A43A|nr:hypothetical protein [Mangrovibacterium lignilyticum]